MDDKNALHGQLFPMAGRKGDLKKVALVEELIKQIAERGLESVTLESVGKSLGIRRSHVVYHFPTLAQLILAAVQHVTAWVQQKIVERVKRAKTPQQRLFALLDANFEWMDKHPEHQAILLLFWSGCLREPSLQGVYRSILSGGRDRLCAILGPTILKSAELEKAALEIQSWITGTLLNLSLTESPKVSSLSRKKAREALGIYYRRYCKHP
jgi:TetR/AcrR family transcriptional repressor of bet genes